LDDLEWPLRTLFFRTFSELTAKILTKENVDFHCFRTLNLRNQLGNKANIIIVLYGDGYDGLWSVSNLVIALLPLSLPIPRKILPVFLALPFYRSCMNVFLVVCFLFSVLFSLLLLLFYYKRTDFSDT